MQTPHIKKHDVPHNKKRPQADKESTSRPSSSNGFGLSTAQLHQLLSGDQENTCHDPFEKAVHKQQQLLTICNLLDRQNSLHNELHQLISADKGAHWIDQQISEFKSLCPAEILNQLSHPPQHTADRVAHSEIINLNFFSLISELLYTPLTTLTRIQTSELNDHDRQDWYEWCVDFNNKLASIKQRIESARAFFQIKTFDKLHLLTNDKAVQQQIGSMKNLFQSSNLLDHDVEFS